MNHYEYLTKEHDEISAGLGRDNLKEIIRLLNRRINLFEHVTQPEEVKKLKRVLTALIGGN